MIGDAIPSRRLSDTPRRPAHDRGVLSAGKGGALTYRFIAPHAGMVAMIQSRHIAAMLIYDDKTKLGNLLQSSK